MQIVVDTKAKEVVMKLSPRDFSDLVSAASIGMGAVCYYGATIADADQIERVTRFFHNFKKANEEIGEI